MEEEDYEPGHSSQQYFSDELRYGVDGGAGGGGEREQPPDHPKVRQEDVV